MLTIGILFCINSCVLSAVPADLVSDDWEKMDGFYEWIKTGCGKAGMATMGKPTKTYLPFNIRDTPQRCGWLNGKYTKAEWGNKDETDCNKNGSTILLRVYDATTKCTGGVFTLTDYKWDVDHPTAGDEFNTCIDSGGESRYTVCAKPTSKGNKSGDSKDSKDKSVEASATASTFKASLAFVVLFCSYIML